MSNQRKITDDVSWLMDPEVVAATIGIGGTPEQFRKEIDDLRWKHPEIDFEQVFARALEVLDEWESDPEPGPILH